MLSVSLTQKASLFQHGALLDAKVLSNHQVCTGGVTTNIGCETDTATCVLPVAASDLKPHRCCEQSTSASLSR